MGYVEFNEYCQKVIAQRIKDGILPNAPIFTDVREFIQSGAAEQYRGIADVVTGGFPCQPFSVAGKGEGVNDPRNMWPSTIECVRLVRPRYCLFENVPGLLVHRYMGTIFGDLAEAGYDAKWCVFGANDCGAPHRRKRLWIVAHASNQGLERRQRYSNKRKREICEDEQHNRNKMGGRPGWCGKGGAWWATDPADLPDTDKSERQTCGTNGIREGEPTKRFAREGERPTLPDVGRISDELAYRMEFFRAAFGGKIPRVATGIPNRVDRLKAIGNGQVPSCVAAVWKLLSE